MGLNIMYERNNLIQVYLCTGNARKLPLSYSVPAAALGREIDIILTFEFVADGQATMTLYVDDVATSVSGAFSEGWTGNSDASFGLLTSSQCAISTKADFTSGSLNADYGLWFFSGSIYKPQAASFGLCIFSLSGYAILTLSFCI